jgi:hypothetical protein
MELLHPILHYSLLLLFPATRIAVIGLTLHIITDILDCLLSRFS